MQEPSAWARLLLAAGFIAALALAFGWWTMMTGTGLP
jgi:hypothetical protein